jgi:2-haloacid dehalogenase
MRDHIPAQPSWVTMTSRPLASTTAVDAVVFDVGNVLVEWDPRRLYRKLSDDPERIDAFLTQVCNAEWNHRIDLGEPWDELIADLAAAHPGHREWIQAYHQRWDEMLGEPIEASVAALHHLRDAGIPVYALSNFSTETWPIAVARYDVLSAFDDVVLSGEVRLAKPDPAIYDLVVRRFGVTPSRTLFVDDRADNVAAAAAAGWLTHHFTDPAALQPALARLGLPTPAGQPT